jgi:cell division septation protein DedD
VTAGYAVQLSAPSVEADANALRDRARAAGFPSFVQRIEVEGGVRWRVRVGPFADRAAAEAARGTANGKLGTNGIVMRHP